MHERSKHSYRENRSKHLLYKSSYTLSKYWERVIYYLQNQYNIRAKNRGDEEKISQSRKMAYFLFPVYYNATPVGEIFQKHFSRILHSSLTLIGHFKPERTTKKN